MHTAIKLQAEVTAIDDMVQPVPERLHGESAL